MKKAYAYLRVSGKGQVKGDGFPRQLQAIKNYATEHDLRVVQVFREEGVAGNKESMDRPAWAEMMTALLGNGVKTIIIEKLDRLARDLMVQELTIADLAKNGITLISVAEPDLMANDPTRILMRQLMGAVARRGDQPDSHRPEQMNFAIAGRVKVGNEVFYERRIHKAGIGSGPLWLNGIH